MAAPRSERVLLHVSEDPTITRFVPHVPPAVARRERPVDRHGGGRAAPGPAAGRPARRPRRGRHRAAPGAVALAVARPGGQRPVGLQHRPHGQRSAPLARLIRPRCAMMNTSRREEGDRHGSDDGHGPGGQPPRLALLGPAQRLRQPAGRADDVEQQPARSGHAGERDRDDAGAPQPHRRRPLLRDVDAGLRRPRRRGPAGAAQPGQRHPGPGGPDAGRGRAGRPAVPPGRVRRRPRRPRPRTSSSA